jgi:hypothetical protein
VEKILKLEKRLVGNLDIPLLKLLRKILKKY